MPTKTIDGSALPPCKAELQHFLRSYFIANLWANSHRNIPTDLDPLNYGWEEEDNKYVFKWFIGEQLPALVDDIKVLQEDTFDEQQQQEDAKISISSSEDENDDEEIGYDSDE